MEWPRSQLEHGEKSNNKRDFSNLGNVLPSSGMKGQREEGGGVNRAQELGLAGGS